MPLVLFQCGSEMLFMAMPWKTFWRGLKPMGDTFLSTIPTLRRSPIPSRN